MRQGAVVGFIEKITLPTFEGDNDPLTREKHLRALSFRYSVDIQRAIDESDIASEGGDFSWLADPRIAKVLYMANAAHHGQKRKYGDQSRLIHEIWLAHQMFNDPDVQKDLKQRNLDPVLGAFCAIIHDIWENEQAWAKAHSMVFHSEYIIGKIAAIWGDSDSFKIIQKECIDYMTDDKDLPPEWRIPGQKSKSYDKQGTFILSVLQQGLKMYDKLHHALRDAVYCEQQSELGNNITHIAQRQLSQAEQKSFSMLFPIAAKIKPRYDNAIAQMRNLAHPAAEVRIKPICPIILSYGQIRGFLGSLYHSENNLG